MRSLDTTENDQDAAIRLGHSYQNNRHSRTTVPLLLELVLAAAFFCSLSATASARISQNRSTTVSTAHHRQVIASTSDRLVRFVSIGELTELRVEAIAPTGEVVFDAGFKPGNVIEWRVTDQQGQHLPDGSYPVSYTHLTLPTIYSV